jgi:hypothetical protein
MALVLVMSLGVFVPKAGAQSDKYPKRAAVDQYLMERNAEILLAQWARRLCPVPIGSSRRRDNPK